MERTGMRCRGKPFFLRKERFPPGTPSKESRFYAVCPAEGGSGRMMERMRQGDQGQTNQGFVCGGNLSFLRERKVSPAPPSKESRFYAVRPAEGEAGGAGTDGETSIRAGESGACTRLCVLSAKERFPPDPLSKKAAYAPSAPHRARRAARGRTEKRVSEQANQEHVRGCAFFLRKQRFPPDPLPKKAADDAVRPA